jgi:hypothetical protein
MQPLLLQIGDKVYGVIGLDRPVILWEVWSVDRDYAYCSNDMIFFRSYDHQFNLINKRRIIQK